MYGGGVFALKCDKWWHKRCSELRDLNRMVDICCLPYIRRMNGEKLPEEEEAGTTEMDVIK